MFQHVKEHENKKVQLLRDTIDNPFAWPGGYTFVCLMSDGEAMCIKCTKKEYSIIKETTLDDGHTGWEFENVFINWEDGACYCCNCGERLVAEYEDQT